MSSASMPSSVTPPKALFADQPLVGRGPELGRLAALLDRPPALAVVRGGPGSGKSSLLSAFRGVATQRDWRIVQLPALRPDTGRDDFKRSLRAQMGLPEILLPGREQPRGDQLLRSPSAGSSPGVVSNPTSSLLAALCSRSTLLLLDDFDATEDVEQWFLHELIDDIRATAAPVVAVIAARTVLADAVALADHVIDVELPTKAELRRYLEALGTLLEPPANASELDVLSAEVAAQPRLIGPLIRALGLVRIDD